VGLFTFQSYAQVSSLFYAFVIAFYGMIFGILAKFSFGRVLLEKFPGLFSAGAVSKDGPKREVAENTNFVKRSIKLNNKILILAFL